MIQKLVCENCGHIEETSEVFFTDESLKCPICGYKRQIIEVKNVQEISNDHPYGFFFRGAHYWSAQVFIVLTLLHIADHFLRRSYARGAASRWVFLTLSTVIVFFYPLPVSFLKVTRKGFLQEI